MELRKLFLFLFLLSSTAQADITTGLVDWWKINEGSGTSSTDYGSNAANISWVGTPSWTATGGPVYSAYLSFTGSPQCGSAATNLSSLTGYITVAFWLKQTSFSGDNDSLGYEYTATWNSYNSIGLDLEPSTGPPVYAMETNLNVSPQYNATSPGGTPSTGSWHHWVIIYNRVLTTHGPGAQIYIDGNFQNSTNSFNAAYNVPMNGTAMPNSSLYIMCRNEASLYDSGSIQDLRIYNRALSGLDIKQLYNYPAKLPTVINNATVKNATLSGGV